MLYEGLVGSRSHLHFPIPRRRCFKLFLFSILGLDIRAVHSSASRLHGNTFDAFSSHGVFCDTALLSHFHPRFFVVEIIPCTLILSHSLSISYVPLGLILCIYASRPSASAIDCVRCSLEFQCCL